MNECNNPKQVHPPLGAYSHAVKVPPNASWLVLSGQVGVNAKGKLQPGMRRRPRQAFRNVLACLRANGMRKENLVKFVVYVTDPAADRGVPRGAREGRRQRRDFPLRPCSSSKVSRIPTCSSKWRRGRRRDERPAVQAAAVACARSRMCIHHRAQIVRKHRIALLALVEVGEASRAGRDGYRWRVRPASGNFAGWAVASVTNRGPHVRREAARPRPLPTAVCGSMTRPVSRCTAAMASRVSASPHRPAWNSERTVAAAPPADPERAALGELAHQSGDAFAVPAVHLEQQPLEIAGDLDVHRGRQRRVTSVSRWSPVVSARVRMSFSLLATASRSTGRPIRCATKPAKHVAEVPRRHRERNGHVGPAKRDGGGDVIDHLGDDARPVDGVHPPRAGSRRGTRRPLNIALSIAWQSSKVPSMAMLWTLPASTVVICRRWTSEILPAGWRMKIDARPLPRNASMAAEPVSPGGRADDGDARVAPFQDVVVEPGRAPAGRCP